MVIDEPEVREALQKVEDPELKFSIVDLGLLYGLDIAEGHVVVKMGLTTPFCPFQDTLKQAAVAAVMQVAGVKSVEVEFLLEPVWSPQMASQDIQYQFVLQGIPLSR